MPIAGKTIRYDAGVGLSAWEEARQPKFVCTNVGDDDVVVGQRRAEVCEDSLRLEREGVVVATLVQLVAQPLPEVRAMWSGERTAVIHPFPRLEYSHDSHG